MVTVGGRRVSLFDNEKPLTRLTGTVRGSKTPAHVLRGTVEGPGQTPASLVMRTGSDLR